MTPSALGILANAAFFVAMTGCFLICMLPTSSRLDRSWRSVPGGPFRDNT